MQNPIRNIVVLGGGSAGLLVALALKRRVPGLNIQLVRSQDIGVIGVGEGTTFAFPQFLLRDLGLNAGQLYLEAEPTWKLGIRFLWGPRPDFYFSFSNQFNYRWPDLPKNNGFYCGDGDLHDLDLWSAMMRRGKALPRQANGQPEFAQHRHVAFHIENKKLVAYLEARAREMGIVFIDGTMREAEPGSEGIAAIHLEDGRRIAGELFVDASGFRSELLGRALGEPFVSYSDTLFCDRAVIGGWPRTTEPILPYTICETMDSGWCWQIEHEQWINRGYVYSSRFISDEAALAEFLQKNPKVANEPRVVKFRTGRYARSWVGNVVAVGNASGFVEPLEATALATIINQGRALTDMLIESSFEPTPGMASLYNRFAAEAWDEIRDFIALHYRFNTRLDSPFWRTCRNEVPLGRLDPVVEFYQENGPTAIGSPIFVRPADAFGMEAYLTLLIGQAVPHRKPYQPSVKQLEAWHRHRWEIAAAAEQGMTVKEGLDWVRMAARGK